MREIGPIKSPDRSVRRLCSAAGGDCVSVVGIGDEQGGSMKVFVAGATVAVGKPLLPLVVAKGCEVVHMTGSPDKAQVLPVAEIEPVVADSSGPHLRHRRRRWCIRCSPSGHRPLPAISREGVRL